MRTMVAVFALAFAGASSAGNDRPAQHLEHEIVFAAASQLLSWCEQEARAQYAGQGVTTYQWTGRHFESGNTLHAEGKIRAGGEDVPVTCVAARGARERHATIRIGPAS
jgi:hypothetical protein